MFSEESEGGVRGQEEKVSRLNSFLYLPPNFFSSRSPLRPFLDWKACSQADKGTRTLSLASLPCRPIGRPRYVFVVNNC